MRVTQNAVDSEVFGGALLEVDDVTNAGELFLAEREWLKDRPFAAVLRLPAEVLPLIHACEDLGFRFCECQIQLRRRITARIPVPTNAYDHFSVTDDRDLEAVLELAGTIFSHDRFSLDPAFGPALSRRRYQAYVRRSFLAPDEIVLALRDRSNGKIVAFSTDRRTSPTEMRALLGGVGEEHQRTGLALVHDHFGNNFALDLGIRAVTTVVSAAHHAVVNIHVGHMGYQVTKTWAILRKTYA